jgi:hypothetical protein
MLDELKCKFLLIMGILLLQIEKNNSSFFYDVLKLFRPITHVFFLNLILETVLYNPHCVPIFDFLLRLLKFMVDGGLLVMAQHLDGIHDALTDEVTLHVHLECKVG